MTLPGHLIIAGLIVAGIGVLCLFAAGTTALHTALHTRRRSR
ncbi:hypothetical protein [Streptomyces sp. NPDC048242]